PGPQSAARGPPARAERGRRVCGPGAGSAPNPLHSVGTDVLYWTAATTAEDPGVDRAMREREHERERLEGKDGAAGAGSLVDALWQAARLSERRADAHLARLDRLAGPGAGGE